MKADLTRSTFRAEKHYSGVRMQQGRVQLDADWNEQVDIEAHLDTTTRIDVIGRCGFPIGAAGFGLGVTPDNSDLWLSAGRGYVDGILCEVEGTPVEVPKLAPTTAVLETVLVDGRELAEGEWVELSAKGIGPVVSRLGSVDASKRQAKLAPPVPKAQVDALVKAGDIVLHRLATFLTQPAFPSVPRPEKLELKKGRYLAYLDVWERGVTALEDRGIRETALGGPDTATRTQTVWQVRLAPVGAKDTCATAPDPALIAEPSSGSLAARARPATTSADPCTIPPGGGFRRLENQLYRVEIHAPGTLGNATFKWSRENGSIAVPWLESKGKTVTVSSLGRDEVLGFAPGNWVELTDDTHEVAAVPGSLDVIVRTDVSTLELQGPAADRNQFPKNPKARRWDDASGPRKVELAAANDGFVALEDGVEIRFGNGFYNTGDYWLIPARTATGDVEWPRDGGTFALPKPPDGIAHHFCKLAILERTDNAWSVVEDCRDTFLPLTAIEAGVPQEDPAIHVVDVLTAAGTKLRNDGEVKLEELRRGLVIVCDGDVEPGTANDKPTCLVTIDVPYPTSPRERKEVWGLSRPFGTIAVTVNAVVRAEGAKILWRPDTSAQQWLAKSFERVLGPLGAVLVHLTLKGNFVYALGDPKRNVDGAAFGLLDAAGQLDAALPSGNGRRGGDLELWFRIGRKGKPPGKTIVVASLPAGGILTTAAQRQGAPKLFGLAVDRGKLSEVGEGFEFDVDASVDPAEAARLAAELKLRDRTLRVVAPEELNAVVRVVEELVGPALGARLNLELLPQQAIVDGIERIVEAGFDLVIASNETIDAANEARPGTFPDDVRLDL